MQIFDQSILVSVTRQNHKQRVRLGDTLLVYLHILCGRAEPWNRPFHCGRCCRDTEKV